VFRILTAAALLAFAPFAGLAQEAAAPPAPALSAPPAVEAAGMQVILQGLDASAHPQVALTAAVSRDGAPLDGLQAHDVWVRENGITQGPLTVTPDAAGAYRITYTSGATLAEGPQEVIVEVQGARDSASYGAAPAEAAPPPAAPAAASAPAPALAPAAAAPQGIVEIAKARIVEVLGPLGPVIVLAGFAVLLILSTIPFLMKRDSDPLDRLKQARTAAAEPKASAVRLRQNGKGEDKLAKYSNFLEPKNDAEYSAVQLKLMQAGYRGKNAVRMYHFAQFALGLLLLLAGVLYAIYSSATGEPTTQNLILSVLIPGVIGYMGPKYWVNKRQEKRKEEITNGFPDALDMMLVCVEAGQSLDQSIIRVAREIRAGFPALADEFEIVSWEIKAGKDKINVLRDMSERAGVADVASFVTVLIQSASFGTSVAEALRVYASEMRDKRVMRAEEKANTLPTKMTLATMMLTVPPLLIILLGPSVYNIAETLGSMAN
jgi:tight adherence protein C